MSSPLLQLTGGTFTSIASVRISVSQLLYVVIAEYEAILEVVPAEVQGISTSANIYVVDGSKHGHSQPPS